MVFSVTTSDLKRGYDMVRERTAEGGRVEVAARVAIAARGAIAMRRAREVRRAVDILDSWCSFNGVG